MKNSTLSIIEKQVTMDSREIAELTGKRHSDVCRDIRKTIESQQLDERRFASVYLGANNQERTCYRLDYEQTMILLTGYSIPLRAKVIKRWSELEQKNLPGTFADALKLAYEQQLAIEQKEALLLEQKPKVDYYDEVLSSEDTITITAIAKENEMGARQLNLLLVQEGIQFKQSGRYYLKAEYQDKGYTKEKTTKIIHNSGEVEIKHSLVWTEKGREFIRDFLEVV